MKNEKINSLQLGSVISILMIASFLGIGMYSIVKIAKVDSYLCLLIAGIVGILLVLSLFLIFDYEPNLNIADKIRKIYGNFFGNILNLILIICFFIISIVAMFNLSNFITSQFLRDTPLIVISIVFGFLIIFINFKGIEVITRTSLILYVLCFLFFIFSIIGLFSQFEVSNLKPFLEFGISKPLKGSLYNLLFNIVPIFLITIVPKNKLSDKKNFKKIIFGYYFVSVLIKFLLILFTIGILGIELASIYQYPEYMVMKRINILSFIDRIENVLTIQWMFGLFISISFIVYYISNTVKTNNISKKFPIILVILIIICADKFFQNNIVFNNFSYTFVPYVMGCILFIYLLVVVGIILKKNVKKIS